MPSPRTPAPAGERRVVATRYAQALRRALHEEMARDPTVILLGQDIGENGGVFTVTRRLIDEFGPERVLDTPISEAAMVGAAVGAAAVGARPVVELQFIDFVGIAMDQLVNQAAKFRYMTGGQARMPMVLRASTGGSLGFGAQHSQSLENWFVGVPGLEVVMPSDGPDALGLLKAAIRSDNPTVFLEHKALYASRDQLPPDGEEHLVPLGRAAIKRAGADVTVVATSRMVGLALGAAAALAERGVEVEVVDPRTLKPLDTETIIASVQKTGRAVVVNEAPVLGGFASELAALIQEEAFDALRGPVIRVGAADVPIPVAKSLEAVVLPQVEHITAAIERTLRRP